MLLVILMVKKELECFIKNNLKKKKKKKCQTEIRVKNIIKRKGDKLYVKWKGYDNFFNSWIDKKDVIE